MMKTFTKLLAVVALSLLTTGAMAQIFVDASKTGGANNGTSWANAYTDLQSALDDPNLTTIGQIWVAKGTYKPTKTLAGTVETPVSRDATFVLPEGVKIYGGFTGAGTEASINDRVDISTTNETILSGDFNNDDVVTIDGDGVVSGITGNAENAHHVVVSYNNTAATLLDGFTIKGGNANGTGTLTVDTDYGFDRNRGGGISSVVSSPTFNNLIVKNNHALAGNSTGAGIYLNGSKAGGAVNITNSFILTNWASYADGTSVNNGSGAIYAVAPTGNTLPLNISQVAFTGNSATGVGAALRVSSRANAVLQDVWFTKNAASLGGAIYIGGGTLSITRGEFKENRATTDGGAIYTLSVKTILNDCTFEKNTGTRGGALHANTDGKYNIKNTNFKQNEGTTGGAIHGNLRSIFDIEGGIFEENTGTTGGAIYGVSNASGDPAAFTIKGVSFIKNTTSGDNDGGGAIYGSTASSFNINGSTFRENTTAGTGNRYGGAIYITSATSGFVINNSQFIGNTASAAGAIYTISANTVPRTINNTIFYSNSTRGNGNGGAVTLATNSVVTITNSTFYSNTASGTGAGGALRYISGTLNVHNSIILGNIAGSDPDVSGTATITYSLTQGATGTNVNTSAVAADVFLNTTYGNTDFLKLKPVTGNPAIDAGDNNLVPRIFSNDDPPVDVTLTAATDLAGALRFNGTVDLGAYENHTPLPIKLANFSAKANGSSIIVSWATETETNNNHFILEKSTDGVNFSVIATVPSKGNGAKYSYTDFSPTSGNNYYRLTQVDNDGTKVSFNPVVVNFSLGSNTEVSVYPNPAIGGKVTVNLANKKYTSLQLVNLYGQKLQSLNIAPNETEKTIDVSPYPSGTYFILLTNGTEKTVKKIVKP